jgi:hypothetical protein
MKYKLEESDCSLIVVLFRHVFGGAEVKREVLSHDSCCHGRDLDRASPECGSRAVSVIPSNLVSERNQ